MEIAVPLKALTLNPGSPVGFQFRLLADDIEIEAHPPASLVAFNLPAEEWVLVNRSV